MNLDLLDPVASGLISNTLVAAMLALLALAAERLWRRPGLAHGLWILVLIKLLTPAILPVAIPVDPSRLSWVPPAPLVEASPLNERLLQSVPDSIDAGQMVRLHRSLAAPPIEGNATDRPWWPWVMSGWGLGAIVMGAWIVRASRRVRQLIERRGRFDIAATRQLATLARASAGSAPKVNPPQVWLVSAVVSPMLVASLLNRSPEAARIVLPKTLWLRLDEQARAALLLHELEHWRRRDTAVRLIEVIAMIALWWHPLVWIAKRQIEECEEHCCDLAASSQPQVSPRQYAEAILTTLDFLCEPLERSRCEVQVRPLASGVGRLPSMEQRLRHIMTATAKGPSRWSSRVVVLVMLIAIPLAPTIEFRRHSNQHPPRDETPMDQFGSEDRSFDPNAR